MSRINSHTKHALAIIKDAGFVLHEYMENGKVCGYEAETWTDDIGIDMILFIDLRETSYPDGITARNIANEVKEAYTRFDVDEETISHWQAYSDLHTFGISRIAKDFKGYESLLCATATKLSQLV